jgi:hypothetical protein
MTMSTDVSQIESQIECRRAVFTDHAISRGAVQRSDFRGLLMVGPGRMTTNVTGAMSG